MLFHYVCTNLTCMKKIIIAIISLILFSCKETKTEEMVSAYFYFDSPQPVNDSELSSFPTKFRGVYVYEDMQMHIEKEFIYNGYREEWKVAKTTLDSMKDIITYKEGNRVVIKEGKYLVEYKMKDEGDSLYLYRWRNDTVFRFSPTQKAKRVNGQLVLSTKDSIYWQVRMLSIKKDTLNWKYLTSSQDYIALKPIVKNMSINADTSQVYMKPTRKEFTKILLLDSLTVTKYKKIK